MRNKKSRSTILKQRKPINIAMLILFLILFLYTLFLVFPLCWGLWTSFKTNIEYSDNKLWFPSKFTFKNYKNAFKYFYIPVIKGGVQRKVYLEEMLLNTMLYSLGCAFFSSFTPFLVAYLTATYDYKFSRIVNKIVLIVMIVPVVGSLPSEIQMAKNLGLFDNMFGVWILAMSFLGMYYLVFYSIFKSIPKEYMEAASIDGASNTKIMFKIIMPLAIKSFLVVFLIKFVFYWNEYQTAIVFIPSYPTLSSGLLNFEGSSINEISGLPCKMAGCMTLCVPILVLFIIFKEKLMGNVSMGGIKG